MMWFAGGPWPPCFFLEFDMVSLKRSLECPELRELRLQAKQLKKEKGMCLSHAYHVIAISMGYKSWISLLTDKGWN